MNTRFIRTSILLFCLIGSYIQSADPKPASSKKTEAKPSFSAEPVHIKGSGSCEGAEMADLDGDGKLDIISAVPMSGQITFYKGAGGNKPTFANKVVLSDSKTKKPIKTHHW